MKSNTTLIFTVRNFIKGEPRIIQEKIFLDEKDYKSLMYIKKLIDTPGLNNDILEPLTIEFRKRLNGYDYTKYCSIGSIYYKAIGKWICTKEGFFNSRLKN